MYLILIITDAILKGCQFCPSRDNLWPVCKQQSFWRCGLNKIIQRKKGVLVCHYIPFLNAG